MGCKAYLEEVGLAVCLGKVHFIPSPFSLLPVHREVITLRHSLPTSWCSASLQAQKHRAN